MSDSSVSETTSIAIELELLSLFEFFLIFLRFCTGVAWLSSARGAKPSSQGTGISLAQYSGLYHF